MIETKKLTNLFRLGLRRLLFLVCLGLCGALASATLVRFAPGYGVEERELDPRWSANSVEALRQKQALRQGLPSFYFHYLSALAHGDLGESDSLKRPVRELLRQRFPVTGSSVIRGLGVAWLAAALLASFGLVIRGWFFEASTTAFNSLLLSLPSAVVAMLAVHLRTPVFFAIAIVVFPRLYGYIRSLLVRAYDQPHVLAARARGLGGSAILFRHVLPLAAPPLVALLGVSFAISFGAAIPIEALCDSPGLGQLAWHAALSRDLPLIVNVTLIVTLVMLAANSLADTAGRTIAGSAS
ncbi:MAG TPA: ABC transporter permease [Candidatus Polarisedimenticolia bacterium]|nr:ABC transporter permease [Candidatus Polarisedimenticolia bacterium]